MRLEYSLNKKIERCQAQIAAIYDLPISQQCPITLEGFQRKLKFLLNEKSLLNIEVYQTRTVLPNRSEVCAAQHSETIKQRALQTHNCTIRQLNPRAL